MKLVHVLIATIVAVGLTALGVSAKEPKVWKGQVERVLDGDTVKVKSVGTESGGTIYRTAGLTVTIRLEHIDAPEKAQSGGMASKSALESFLPYGHVVTVVESAVDRYGRAVAVLQTYYTVNVNIEQVRAGHAWWYQAFSRDRAYKDAEEASRASRKGLWAEPKPVAPWEWRKAQKVK